MAGRGRVGCCWARRGCGPIRCPGSEEALDLAVPAWCVGRDADVAGAELGERGAEHVAVGVALGVVAHDSLDGPAALLAQPRGGAAQRGGDACWRSRRVDFAVGQPRVVVDDADDLDLAGVAGAVALGAIAVRPVPGPIELGQARRRRCAAARRPRSTRSGGWSADARCAGGATRRDAPGPCRSSSDAGRSDELQLHRPPVGLLARHQDRGWRRRSAPTDTTAAASSACANTPATHARPRTGRPPAMPPPMRRRRRNAEGGRGAP